MCVSPVEQPSPSQLAVTFPFDNSAGRGTIELCPGANRLRGNSPRKAHDMSTDKSRHYPTDYCLVTFGGYGACVLAPMHESRHMDANGYTFGDEAYPEDEAEPELVVEDTEWVPTVRTFTRTVIVQYTYTDDHTDSYKATHRGDGSYVNRHDSLGAIPAAEVIAQDKFISLGKFFTTTEYVTMRDDIEETPLCGPHGLLAKQCTVCIGRAFLARQ